MTGQGEDVLIALISKEQRGFRRILIAGLVVLVMLVVMSAALGYFYAHVASELGKTSERLELSAFTSRSEAEQQTNRVASLERAVRKAYDEIRDASADTPTTFDRETALRVTADYLRRDHHVLADERLIDSAAADSAATSPELHDLLEGAAQMLAWERSGETIKRGANDLPERLKSAEAAFRRALAHPDQAALAQTGIGWVHFIDAGSVRSNFAAADCQKVFDAVTAATRASPDGDPGAQPLFWRAACERKLGQTKESLRDYSLALKNNAPEVMAENGKVDEDDLTIAMNAFHGVGTELVATADLPDTLPEMSEAIALANRFCPVDPGDVGSPRMKLARACMEKAIDLRRRLHQTENELGGTRENIGFTYLRDHDYAGALENAATVEQTSLSAWNELIRALSAGQLPADKKTDATRTAERDARRNVKFFDPGRFNVCELHVLLTKDVLDQAIAIIAKEHPDKDISCQAEAASR